MNRVSMTPLALALALFATGAVMAQDSEPETSDAGSEEVDVNEESYRAFMELDDRDIQRNNFPVAPGPMNVPRSLTGLPEESQRHLREQLRDIIVGGGPWSPEDAGRDYPYVPSAAAEGDTTLQRKEAGAWAELVGEYHAREAAIYEAGQRASAANASAGTNGGQPGSQGASGQAGQDGAEASDSGEAGTEGQAGAESATAKNAAQQSASTSSAESASRQASSSENSPQAPRTSRPPDEGVSQSALEYLTGQPAPPPPPVSEARPAPGDVNGMAPRRSLTREELEQAAGLARPDEQQNPDDQRH